MPQDQNAIPDALVLALDDVAMKSAVAIGQARICTQEEVDHELSLTTVIDVDGYVVNVTTGEVTGYKGDDEKFVVDDEKSVEWVLSKMADVDFAIKAKQDRLAQVAENLNAQIKELSNKAAWLEKRFFPELLIFAEGMLLGQKAKSIKMENGTLGFRAMAGSTKVIDAEKALEWCKKHKPEAVVVKESVVVTPLKNVEDLPADAFEITYPGSKFYRKL